MFINVIFIYVMQYLMIIIESARGHKTNVFAVAIHGVISCFDLFGGSTEKAIP